jgi:hypothetical protein
MLYVLYGIAKEVDCCDEWGGISCMDMDDQY